MDEEALKPCALLGEKLSNLKYRVVKAYKRKPLSYWILLVLSGGGMVVALPASSLIGRIYYENGGRSKWIISWVCVAGWPLTALMLLPAYFFFETCPTPLTLQLLLSYVVLGFLIAFDNMMFAYAYAYLPASTATLLSSSSLVFVCLFGYLIANNKLNASVLNATVIIVAAISIIALDSDSKRRDNVSDHQYILGFVWVILASVLKGLNNALSELVFIKLLGRRSFHVVFEKQAMVCLFAFIFTTIGVIVTKDFDEMKSEAKIFLSGEASYIKLLICAAITSQLATLGNTGVIFLGSALTATICDTVRDPITIISAVIFLHDPMSGLKILSSIQTLWGFSCYIYGISSSLKV